MTVFAEPVLRDPIEEFFDRGPQDDLEEERTHPDVVKVGVALAAAFIVLRAITKQRLAEETPSTAQAARKLTRKVWRHTSVPWMAVSGPALLQAFKLGAAGRTYPELEKMATLYAEDLGAYVSQTSGEALVEGFAAQLNAGWSSDLAWIRSVEAWGLDKRQMRTYVTGLLKADRTVYSTTDPVTLAARSVVDRLFLLRADKLGINEAFRASQLGRNIAWMALQNAGDLPATAMKKWVTADDERVCEVCAPLHQQVIGLRERFESNGQKFHAPGVHPNCRCELELVYGDDITKAAPGDPYDRDRKGRFSTDERRSPKTKTKPQMDPVLADLLRQAEKEYETQPEAPAKSQADIFGTTSQADIFATSQADIFGGPSQADIFSTKSQADIFGSKSQEDIFRDQSSIFSTQTDIFAQDDPFQRKMRQGAKRLIIIRRFRNGKEEVETEVRPSPEVKFHKDTTMFADVGDFLVMLAEARGVEKVKLQTGQFIQIDELSTPKPTGRDGTLVQHVAEIPGYADLGAGGIDSSTGLALDQAVSHAFINEFLPAFDTAYSNRAAAMADVDADQEITYALEDYLYGDPDALSSLSHQNLTAIARHAFANGAVPEELGSDLPTEKDVMSMSGQELAEAISDAVRFERDAYQTELSDRSRDRTSVVSPMLWAEAVETVVAPSLFHGSASAATAASDSSLGPGEGVDPPTVFSFAGFYGAVDVEDYDRPDAFAQGTYKIVSGGLIHVTRSQKDKLIKEIGTKFDPVGYDPDVVDAALTAFTSYRLVRLSPVSPARMPKEDEI